LYFIFAGLLWWFWRNVSDLLKSKPWLTCAAAAARRFLY
jgi:hypothetical protein